MKTVNQPFQDNLGQGLIYASQTIKQVYFERNQLYLALIKLMLETEVHTMAIDLETDGAITRSGYSVEFLPDTLVPSRGAVNLVHHTDKDLDEDIGLDGIE